MSAVIPSDRFAFAGITSKRDDAPDFGGWSHDPFVNSYRPRAATPVREDAGPDLNLSVISTKGGNSMAIINGNILTVNGSVDGWTVTDIDDHSVLLTNGQEKERLTLKRR